MMTAADHVGTAVETPGPEAPAWRRRPRDRKRHILDAAAASFWTSGYHQVSMADVAAEVGITASALYRHYRGKQDLLVEVLRDALEHMEREVAPARGLDELLDGLVSLGVQRREFGALWDRERRNLETADRERFAAQLRALTARLTAAVAAERPSEPADVAEIRAHALVAVAESPSFHRLAGDGARLDALLRRAAATLVSTPLQPADDLPAARSGRHPQVPVSRREVLLSASVRLFADRGYPSVGLADIGAATGITGPSVYSYFSSKSDLLVSALNRGNEALWLDLHHALDGADGPADAQHRAVQGYVHFAAANPETITVTLCETLHLPPELRVTYRRYQQEYVTELVALLQATRPELHGHDARALVNAALAVPNGLVRTTGLSRPASPAEIVALATAVLLA